jgi:hypothetical protein
MYRVHLDGKEIGTTLLEHADAPMGVVFGKISFSITSSPYKFIHDYCQAHNIPVSYLEPDVELIHTEVIPELRVFRADNTEISGLGCCIEGMKDDGYDITILGISYPFYAEEFPHHCKADGERFKA